jgi:hypothetical protein
VAPLGSAAKQPTACPLRAGPKEFVREILGAVVADATPGGGSRSSRLGRPTSSTSTKHAGIATSGTHRDVYRRIARVPAPEAKSRNRREVSGRRAASIGDASDESG